LDSLKDFVGLNRIKNVKKIFEGVNGFDQTSFEGDGRS